MNKCEESDLDILHKRMVELLNEFDRICKKYRLKYFAIGGTLLGAIRHKGFIPWDDDIDVGMKRKDYEQFLEIAAKELGDSFFLQTIYSDFGSTTYQAKLRLNNTLFIERYAKHAKMHQGIFLDIMPLDIVPLDAKAAKRYWQKCFVMRQIYTAKNVYGTMHPINDFSSCMKAAIRFLLHIMLRPIPKIYLYKKLDGILRKYENESTGKITQPGAWKDCVYILEDEIYPIQESCFETTLVDIPNRYDIFLKRHFGDYMKLPSEKERYAHRPYKLEC